MGNRAVGANRIGDAVYQNQLQPIDRGRAHQCVALIDQIKHRSDGKSDVERAARGAMGYGAQASLLLP